MPRPAPRVAPALDADSLERAARLIGDAANPMIMVGGGAFGAAAEVLELAEFLQAFGVPATLIPQETEAKAALFRARISGSCIHRGIYYRQYGYGSTVDGC